ncbi:unnamed protein product [Rotaria sp. Silwood2]|nr:unnamed protein product [Rotaria sp. Silwood2]CAF4216678.1 unnamed protein product [Rotaria sp. Silwood2]
MDDSVKSFYKKKEDSQNLATITNRIQTLIKLVKGPGVHSVSYMSAAGFEYTNDGDTARCKDCGLEVPNWASDMNPFTIHSKSQPNCPFIHSIILISSLNVLAPSKLPANTTQNISVPTVEENISTFKKVKTMNFGSLSNTLVEVDSLRQVRIRTFSHWPHHTVPSNSQMIEAGFFCCNVGDRVICIYCNLICQQWISYIDDPCEVHKTLSPNCIYVKTKLMNPVVSSIAIVNESSTTNIASSTSNNLSSIRTNDIVFRASCNPTYSEILKRQASFATWPNENLPQVDDLVRAGFFYTGAATIATCFYCNGSLQNWGSNDNPMIEHARWFPYCAYAKQLCGEELYRKIQESKRIQQKRARAKELREEGGSNDLMNINVTENSGKLLIPDESTLSRLVAARLDLSISQHLLDQHFKLSIVKRCWEDQLRIKHDDFVSDCDLYIACLILRKQIEHIDGKKENIVIPSIKMKQMREQNETEISQQKLTTANEVQSIENRTDTEVNMPSQSLTSTGNEREVQTNKKITNVNDQSQSLNLCVLCITEEKKLACIPCGHMSTCVACGHSLRSCPICRREIDAFIRIYI